MPMRMRVKKKKFHRNWNKIMNMKRVMTETQTHVLAVKTLQINNSTVHKMDAVKLFLARSD